MALHLIKLVVGCDGIEELEARGRDILKQEGVWRVHTRSTPVRATELIEAGSIYRVIKGVILCRQRILAIDTMGEGRASRCEITVSPEMIAVAPTPKRPFQGWRYLQGHEAPEDLAAGTTAEAMPTALVLQLRELGAW
jgi:hypothetical protein